MDLTGIGSIADLAKGIMDRFIPPQASEAERAAIQVQLQEMIDKRESIVLDVQKSVMVAEMAQEDPFTKRARPMVVYAGLCFIFLIHVVLPMISFCISRPMPGLSLPDYFWQVWGGICSVWMIGRSAEKLGLGGATTKAVTGRG